VTPDLETDRRLLADVFPHDAKFRNSSFLEWQYTMSPSGNVIAESRDDAAGRVGHYAVLPQRWSVGGQVTHFALSLNTAVAERGRGQGLFTSLAEATYVKASNAGVAAIVGVANAQSTPGFLGKLGFTLIGPLDVSILLPRPRRGASVDRVALTDLSSDELRRYQPGESAVARVWDERELHWRLSDPGKAFSLFASDQMLAVTCAARQRGVRVAVILKVLAASESGALDVGKLVNAACLHHRALFALHAGSNSALSLSGVSLPQRLRPSPLNLIVKSLNPTRPVTDFVPTTFEFLEFDAY